MEVMGLDELIPYAQAHYSSAARSRREEALEQHTQQQEANRDGFSPPSPAAPGAPTAGMLQAEKYGLNDQQRHMKADRLSTFGDLSGRQIMPRGQVGQFIPYNSNQIYMTSPDSQLLDGPAPQIFNTHTGAITQAAGRGGLGGGTWNIGDEGYQALIDKYNTNNPQGAPLTSLAGVSGQMSGIASQLGDYGPQMSDLQSQFGTRGETISGMQEQIGGFGDQFSKINEGIGGLTSQYGDMQKLLNNFQSQTADFSGGIHDQLGQMEGRIGQLEQQSQTGGGFGGGFGGNNFNPVYSGGSNYTQSPGYGGNYMPLNFGTGLNMPNSGSYPSSAYYGGISPFMFEFY